MSLRKTDRLLIKRTVLSRVGLILAAWTSVALAPALPACAQYVGKVTKDAKESPELRSIAVLEWTGDPGTPSASRLVPVAVFDAGQLQDGGIYLARPEPLALVPEVEYELQQDGKPVGLFDIKNAGQVDGGWVGFGAWKPLPTVKPKRAPKLAGADFDNDAESDTPVLHRKHHSGDPASTGKDSGGASSPDASGQDAPSDPDRPTLHKKASTDSTDSAGSASDAGSTGGSSPTSGTASGSASGTASAGTSGPVLHKKDSGADSTGGDSDGGSQQSDDPDRPVMKKPKKPQPAQTASAAPEDSDSDSSADPDRPRLKRGKSSGDDIEVAPSLKGFPPDVQQAVAVSDAKTRPAHPWSYAWSNPDDEAKMKSSMEDLARDALGLNPPPAKPAAKRSAAGSTATRTSAAKKAAKPAPPATPVPLDNEQFRVFELAYGSGATLVLSAHTDGPVTQQKFVTIVAQPDLYGNVLVLLKNVTDGTHLDEKPRMRLVDAVDAMADNRGELLFELRGATQRQFALYRVLRGQAEKLFVTGGADAGDGGSE
ncbi:MAG: hypothetical protein ABSF53_27230 [Terracidiphilus sp.]